MKKFEYLRPDSIKETISILSQHGERAQILNGGTDLIVEMRDKIIQPEYLVDIKAIPQLNRITYNKQDGLNIGATVTLNEISDSKVVRAHYPILVEACKTVGSYQVRNRATLVGNICNASPAADTAPPLLVLEAKVNIIGPTGEKIVPINQFFTGVKKNILKKGEIVTSITIPPIKDKWTGVYLKQGRKKEVDLATVGVAVVCIRDEVRIALGAVAPVPVRAFKTEELLKGKTIDEPLLEKAGKSALTEVSPISDIRSSKEYREEIIKVLVKRAILQVKKRA
ncbi:xanthine dehydrogenase family protein subunit M [bacterium]|nr:xanthine dehydrogenase family protein subunit M [bacterium]